GTVGRVGLGIGVNINQTTEELPAETPKPATALRIETGREGPRAPLLAAILLALERRPAAWSPGGGGRRPPSPPRSCSSSSAATTTGRGCTRTASPQRPSRPCSRKLCAPPTSCRRFSPLSFPR